MKISIITAVFNNKATIADAIDSVLTQSYANIEFIVIDGASTDGTLDVINRYRDRISVIESKPDKGLYDGLNKGLALATGDVVGFLHSDDLYENNQVIEKVVAAFQKHYVDSVYGDLVYVKEHDTRKVTRYWQSGLFETDKLKHGWMPPHPTFFIKRRFYERFGGFDTSFKIAADYDLILRMLGKHCISTHYIPHVLVRMRTGGVSNRSLKNILLKSKEDLLAMRGNNVGSIFCLLAKNVSKLRQFALL